MKMCVCALPAMFGNDVCKNCNNSDLSEINSFKINDYEKNKDFKLADFNSDEEEKITILITSN